MISIFTPSHDPTYLDECWESLKAQTFTDWEWVVVLNGGARWPRADSPFGDYRVRVLTMDQLRGVGAAKSYAVEACKGDVLVELDHDDVLTSDALWKINRAFNDNPGVGFVYSDGAQILEDGSRDTSTWDTNNGWSYQPQTVRFGTSTGLAKLDVLMVEAMEPTPHNVSYIWFAPNHVRAFRRSAYDAAGGYDPDRDVLDDQDLMCRLYQQAEFLRIPRCLYLQRVHDQNTQRVQHLNDRIQVETVAMYDRYVEGNALAWAGRRGLPALDLGGALNPAPGYLTVDQHEPAHWVGDVFDVLGKMADSSVGVVRASDFLEHVADSVRLMNEIYRVLAPDGMLLSLTPSTDGRGAFQDPTHVSYWNENAFWYYCNAEYAKYVPEITARFQPSRVLSFFPTDWHRQNDISYVQANLTAFKPGGHRNGGYLQW